jgi:hypothetical protein
MIERMERMIFCVRVIYYLTLRPERSDECFSRNVVEGQFDVKNNYPESLSFDCAAKDMRLRSHRPDALSGGRNYLLQKIRNLGRRGRQKIYSYPAIQISRFAFVIS